MKTNARVHICVDLNDHCTIKFQIVKTSILFTRFGSQCLFLEKLSPKQMPNLITFQILFFGQHTKIRVKLGKEYREKRRLC